jgi:hypothetical protein
MWVGSLPYEHPQSTSNKQIALDSRKDGGTLKAALEPVC